MWNDTGMADGDPSEIRAGGSTAAAIGARIQQLRTQRGWSLSKLAAEAGLGKATLSEMEAGRRNPTLETLYAIAAQLQIGLSDLLRDEPGRPSPPDDDPADQSRPDHGAPDQGPAVVRGEAVSAELVETFRDDGMTTEVYRLRISPGVRQRSPGHGPGVHELLLITAGRVAAGPVGRLREAGAGEQLSWESSGEHEYRAIGTVVAEAVLVIRHPVRPSTASNTRSEGRRRAGETARQGRPEV